jgi:hypothetical protein
MLDDLIICDGGASDAASLALSARLVLANTEMGLHAFAKACCVAHHVCWYIAAAAKHALTRLAGLWCV